MASRRTRPRYQELPPEIRAEILGAGYISPWQLFRIAAWKSAKGTALLSLNEEQTIVDVTAAAMARLRGYEHHNVISDATDWSAWEDDVRKAVGTSGESGLMALDGVGYPMATAILAVLYPNVFPVMDKWAVAGVFGTAVASKPWQWHKAAVYRAYSERLATATSHELADIKSVHGRDQFVMKRMMASEPIVDLPLVPVP